MKTPAELLRIHIMRLKIADFKKMMRKRLTNSFKCGKISVLDSARLFFILGDIYENCYTKS